MNLHTIRGGTKEALEAHQYNIGVGISLGNKWFTTENILGLIDWSLKYTKDHVVVYVADSIHAINIEVRSRKSPMMALERALGMGNAILEDVQTTASTRFAGAPSKPIYFCHWEDLDRELYISKRNYLRNIYSSDADFRQYITEMVRTFTRNDERNFTDSEIERLGCYIVDELPEVLDCINLAGHEYDAYAYPVDGLLSMAVEQIQSGQLFPYIKDAIIQKSRVFLEVH